MEAYHILIVEDEKSLQEAVKALLEKSGYMGALFWMIVAACLGMATKYSEGLLAVKFREDKGGRFLGGPFRYIEQGMGPGWKWLAKLFAIFRYFLYR